MYLKTFCHTQTPFRPLRVADAPSESASDMTDPVWTHMDFDAKVDWQWSVHPVLSPLLRERWFDVWRIHICSTSVRRICRGEEYEEVT